MNDYSELKKAAEAITPGDFRAPEAWEEDRRYSDEEIRQIDFCALATPEAVLALIAENERLKTLRSTTERDLAQELEVWKHGPSCWSCGDTGDVHDMVGEWRGQCDCNAAKLIDVSSERDQLKAENEALRKDAGRYRYVSDLAWYVVRGAQVYNLCNVNARWHEDRGSPDRDDVEEAIDKEMNEVETDV